MKKLLFLTLPAFLLVACGRDDVSTYQIPKEQPKATAAQMPVQQQPMAQSAAPTGAGFSSELPKGWVEVSGAGMRKVSYTIEGSSVDFYLISLSMGDVPSNVNRWRGQVGLADATPEAIAEDVQTFQAGGHPVNYIEIYNDESGKGIIAAIVDLSPQYWYFTGKGSVEELKTHAADIRAFLESIQFDGHNH